MWKSSRFPDIKEKFIRYDDLDYILNVRPMLSQPSYSTHSKSCNSNYFVQYNCPSSAHLLICTPD